MTILVIMMLVMVILASDGNDRDSDVSDGDVSGGDAQLVRGCGCREDHLLLGYPPKMVVVTPPEIQ